MNGKKIGLIAALVAALVLLLLLVRVIVGLVQGAANFVLGVLVLLALLAIVLWMFAYAKRARK